MPLRGIGGAGARGLALRAAGGRLLGARRLRRLTAGRQAASPLPVGHCKRRQTPSGKPGTATGHGKPATADQLRQTNYGRPATANQLRNPPTADYLRQNSRGKRMIASPDDNRGTREAQYSAHSRQHSVMFAPASCVNLGNGRSHDTRGLEARGHAGEGCLPARSDAPPQGAIDVGGPTVAGEPLGAAQRRRGVSPELTKTTVLPPERRHRVSQ